MSLPRDSKTQQCDDSSYAVPSGIEPLSEPGLAKGDCADLGDQNAENVAVNTEVQALSPPALDYVGIVRTLQRYAENTNSGYGLLFFLAIVCVALLIFANQYAFLLYIIPAFVLLWLICLFWLATQNGRLIRRLTRLTGCRQPWYSINTPEVIDQVQQLLLDAGIDPKADPDGDPAAFCPKSPVRTEMPVVSVPEPKKRFSWKTFLSGLFWSIVLFTGFAVLATGVSVHFYCQPWSILHYPQRCTFDAMSNAQTELQSYYDLYGHDPKTFGDLGKESKAYQEPSPSQAQNKPTPKTGRDDKTAKTARPLITLVQQTGTRHVDGWDRPLYYGTNGQSWRMVSYGADGQPGGNGLNADIAWDNLVPKITSGSSAQEFSQAHHATWGQAICSSEVQSSTVAAVLFACIFCIACFLKPQSRQFQSVGDFVLKLGTLLIGSLVIISIHIGVLATGSSH
ncbi:MAG: type II secretion system protein GspG [Thermoguttaceae bacterium]|nr:type II secretion system protein GspG [Thermoguttaceae bacterium]